LRRNGKVIDRRGLDRSVGVEMSPRLYYSLMTTRGRVGLVVLGVFLVLFVAVVGHIYGRVLASRDILSRDATIQRLRSESQKLEVRVADQEAKLSLLQGDLAKSKAALEAIVPSKNTYVVSPNESLIVADGRLSIGLIGSPSNEGININVNGQQQSVVAGDTVKVAPDPGTTCQVTVQSFNMFKALINASCAPTKSE
jgi:hypothetical protein